MPQTCQGISDEFCKILHQMRAALQHGKSFEKCTRMTTEGTRKYQKRHQAPPKVDPRSPKSASKGYQKGTKLEPKRTKVSQNDVQEQT